VRRRQKLKKEEKKIPDTQTKNISISKNIISLRANTTTYRTTKEKEK